MTKRSDTTVAVNYERKKKLQDAAVDITIATRQQIRMSEIVTYLIDNYLSEAKKDLKAQKEQRNM